MTSIAIEYFWWWSIHQLLLPNDPFLSVIETQLQNTYKEKVVPNEMMDNMLATNLIAPNPLTVFVGHREDWTDVWVPQTNGQTNGQLEFTFESQPLRELHMIVPQNEPINLMTSNNSLDDSNTSGNVDSIADRVATKLQGPLLEILQRTTMNHENTQMANNNLNSNLLAILFANQGRKHDARGAKTNHRKRRNAFEETSSEEEED